MSEDIKGTVRVTGPISPFNEKDDFPVTLEEYKEGGYRSIDNEEDRLAIPISRRKKGMLVKQLDNGLLYELSGGLENENWTRFSFEGEFKDVVFQLGEGLEIGPQPYTEVRVPYEGFVTEVFVSAGSGSARGSNLLFSLDKMNDNDNTWSSICGMNLSEGEYDQHYALPTDGKVPIENERLRITLGAGNFTELTSMSIIARIVLD